MRDQVRLLGVMASVAAGFFLVIKVGFILHHDPQPEPIASPVLTVSAILVFFVGMIAATFSAVRFLSNAVSRARIRRDAKASASRYREIRRLRVAELAADPVRAQYAPLVERGEDWSDENIAYYETPEMTITCEHLEAIERAIRHAGIQVRRSSERVITATCRIDFPSLQKTFEIAAPVRYAEFYQAERDAHDFPTAFLICDAHTSIIHTLHPDQSAADTPWFPIAKCQRI